jgi:hypothetical protein
MSIETEKTKGFGRSRETREVGAEQRETKENKPDAELEKAAALERADLLVKEVKTNKKQMQNILLHVSQVTQAIQQLRAQLQLAASNDDPESVKQDKKQIEVLKKKIAEHQDELIKMREDLVLEQMEELRKGVGVGLSAEELKTRAERDVDSMIETVLK